MASTTRVTLNIHLPERMPQPEVHLFRAGAPFVSVDLGDARLFVQDAVTAAALIDALEATRVALLQYADDVADTGNYDLARRLRGQEPSPFLGG